MNIKTADLTGVLLDLAVAKAADLPLRWEFERGEAAGERGRLFYDFDNPAYRFTVFSPSTDWSQGGPLIERFRVNFAIGAFPKPDKWKATIVRQGHYTDALGDNHLQAAMRAIVAAELGDDVEFPDHVMAFR